MVDVSTLQSLSYVAAAIGVCVAAFYYAFNLRETMKNRRVTLSMNVLQSLGKEDWQLQHVEVMSMQWSDFDDFKRKYDSSVDPESYARRDSVLLTYDFLGQLYRFGVVDLSTFTDIWAMGAVMCWTKFKPIVEGYRGWEWPKGAFSDLEYLANALQRRLSESDPDFMKKLDAFIPTAGMDQ